MSSDKIKDALIAAYPGTSEAQWKRRSKAKVAGGQRRTFENTVTGEHVETIEAPDGTITLGGVTMGEPGRADAKPQVAAVQFYDPSLAAAVTATAQTELLKLVEAIEGVVEIGDTDSILAPVQRGPATRNQMVPKSVWVFNQDVTVQLYVSNPARDRLIEQRFPRGGWMRDPQIAAMPVVVLADVATFPAGTRFTVRGKVSPANMPHDSKQSNGLMVESQLDADHAVQFHMPMGRQNTGVITNRCSPLYFWQDADFEDRVLYIPFSKVAAFIVPETIPETLVYVLRDSATGEYFGGWLDETFVSYGRTHTRTGDLPKMVKKFSSSKKYKNASAVKASIRDFTGYNSGINDSGEEINYIFADGEKKIDLPPTWEMVAVDKTTGAEKEILDVQDWYKDLLRLRTLTQGCGPAVRAAYKKGEGKGHGAIVQFENRSRGLTYHGKPYDEVGPFEDSDDGGKSALAAIKEATTAMGSKFDRVKLQSSVAVACSMADAMAAKMTVSHPDLDITIYDFDTLEKIVEDQPAFA